MGLNFVKNFWDDLASILQHRSQRIFVFRFFMGVLSLFLIETFLKNIGLPSGFTGIFLYVLSIILLYPPLPFDILTQYIVQLDRRLFPSTPRNVELNRHEEPPLSNPERNSRFSSDIQMHMLFLAWYALEHLNQRNSSNHPGIIELRDIPLSSDRDITFNLHNFLEAEGIRSEWIPREYTCPITMTIIDGTPVYAKKAPSGLIEMHC